MTYVKLIAFVALLGTTVASFAAPFVVSDPFTDTRVTHCWWSLNGTAKGDAPLVSSACKLDLTGTPAGPLIVAVKSVALGSVPGYPRLESVEVTLQGVKPVTPAAPVGLAIGVVSNKPTITSAALTAGATHCGWVIDGAAKVDHPVVAGKCSLDVTPLSVGSHTLVATALVTDPIWGRLESASSVPFALSVPSSPAAPAGLGLVP